MPRRLTPAIFAIALVTFFMPWVSISCQGQPLASFSGIQLVTGTTLPGQFGGPPQNVPSEKSVVLIFLATLGGLGLCFVSNEHAPKTTTASAGLAIITLFVFMQSGESTIRQQSNGLLHLEYRAGVYVLGLMLLCAIGLNGYVMASGSSSQAIASTTRPACDQSRFCTACGAKNKASDNFCGECGAKL